MCKQWTRVLLSVEIASQSNPPISQFNSMCNAFTRVRLMSIYDTLYRVIFHFAVKRIQLETMT